MELQRFLSITGILLSSALAQGAGVPQQVTYAGRLTDSAGVALNRIVGIKIDIFDSMASGTSLWSDNLSVGVVDGLYSVALGTTAGDSFPAKLFDGRVLYLELTVDGGKLAPRQAVGSVPYAIRAGTASALGDLVSVEDGAVKLAGTVATAGSGTVANSADLIGAGTAFSTQVHKGDSIVANGISRTVFSVTSDTRVTVDRAWGATFTAVAFTVQRPVARFSASDGSDGLVVTPQGHIGKLPSGLGLRSDGAIAVNEGWVPDGQEMMINSNQIWKSVTTGDPSLYLQYSNPGGSVIVGGKDGAKNNLAIYGDLYVKSGWMVSGTRPSFGLVLQSDRNMVLYDNGVPVWNSGSQLSDIRLKREIAPLGPVLPQLAEMRVIRFKYDGPLRSDQPQLGLVAQEVEKAFPELVYTDKGGHKLVYYDKVSAVQRAKRRKRGAAESDGRAQ
jgi:hypothetical protein